MRTKSLLVAVALAFSSSFLMAAAPSPGPDPYTASPEYRAYTLQQVRAQDKARAEAKAKAQLVTLVDNGVGKATIVISPAPAPEPAPAPAPGAKPAAPKPTVSSDLRAATILQEWIKAMSGVILPIADKAPKDGPAIYVGSAAVDAGADLSGVKSETNEGIRIKADGKNVYIAALDDDAKVRAVARFLEAEFNCRFFTNLEWGRNYPKDQKTLAVMTQDFTEKPVITSRSIWGANGAFRHPYWSTWNGGGGESVPSSHSWHFIPDEEFDKHPEYFRMDEKGNRVKGPWPNLGNPDVRKRFIEWALQASENGSRNLSMSPPDDHRFDYSPESQKYDNPAVIDPSSGLVSMTDRFMTIVNEAAKAIYAKNPKAKLGFYAYSDYTLPPTRPELDKLSPNIMVNIAPIRFSRYHPIGHPNSESTQALRDIIEGWVKRATMLGYRTYNYNLAEVMTPYSKISTWSHDLPYLQKRHFISYNFESFDCWELSAPHLYLSIRLAYDPTQDPWAIMADFYDKFYGPAAVPMEKYWMAVDSAWINLHTESGSIHALQNVYTPQNIKAFEGYITEAETLTKSTPDFAFRVNLAKRGLQRAKYWRTWYDALIAGDPDKAQKTYDEWLAFTDETFKARNGNDYEMTYLRRFIGGNTANAYAAIHPKEATGETKPGPVVKGKPGKPIPVFKELTPRKVIAVLPDDWKYTTQPELDKAGVKGLPIAANFDDSKWKTVMTYSNTLNGQGFPEFLGTMWYRTSFTVPQDATGNLWLHFVKADRQVTVYINGQPVGIPDPKAVKAAAEAAQKAGKEFKTPEFAEDVEAFKGVTIDLGPKSGIKPGEKNQITVRVQHIPLPELYLGGIVAPIHLIKEAK
jgi:hypothetical protein